MFCMEQSLKCIAGNVSILQFLKAFNLQFDLVCLQLYQGNDSIKCMKRGCYNGF